MPKHFLSCPPTIRYLQISTSIQMSPSIENNTKRMPNYPNEQLHGSHPLKTRIRNTSLPVHLVWHEESHPSLINTGFIKTFTNTNIELTENQHTKKRGLIYCVSMLSTENVHTEPSATPLRKITYEIGSTNSLIIFFPENTISRITKQRKLTRMRTSGTIL